MTRGTGALLATPRPGRALPLAKAGLLLVLLAVLGLPALLATLATLALLALSAVLALWARAVLAVCLPAGLALVVAPPRRLFDAASRAAPGPPLLAEAVVTACGLGVAALRAVEGLLALLALRVLTASALTAVDRPGVGAASAALVDVLLAVLLALAAVALLALLDALVRDPRALLALEVAPPVIACLGLVAGLSLVAGARLALAAVAGDLLGVLVLVVRPLLLATAVRSHLGAVRSSGRSVVVCHGNSVPVREWPVAGENRAHRSGENDEATPRR